MYRSKRIKLYRYWLHWYVIDKIYKWNAWFVIYDSFLSFFFFKGFSNKLQRDVHIYIIRERERTRSHIKFSSLKSLVGHTLVNESQQLRLNDRIQLTSFYIHNRITDKRSQRHHALLKRANPPSGNQVLPRGCHGIYKSTFAYGDTTKR